MRRHVTRAARGLLLATALWLAPTADTRLTASVVVPMTLGQLVEAADLILDATVEDVRVVAGPEGAERMVLIRAASAWKGDVDGPVYVRLAGGRLGTTETRVPGVPDVADGERYVWCLVAHPRGGYSVVGLFQGALRTTTGPDGAVRVLAPATAAGARGDVTRLPRAIADVQAQIRALTTGGQP